MDTYYTIADFLNNNVFSLNKIHDISDVLPHSHEFIEMVYILSGSALHNYKGKTVQLHKNDYTFIDYNTLHSFTNKSDDFCVIHCLFVPEFIDISLKNCHTVSDILKSRLIGLFSVEYDGNVFCDTDEKIKSELELMLEEFKLRKFGYTQMIRSSLLKIIVTSIREIKIDAYSNNPLIQTVIDYTNDNYVKNNNLTMLSKQLNYSASRLCTLFKANTGIPYSEYLRQTRIHISCDMLAQTNFTVEKIALQVGYNDVRAYRRNFKQIMGVTPLQYRISIRNNMHL